MVFVNKVNDACWQKSVAIMLSGLEMFKIKNVCTDTMEMFTYYYSILW